MSGTVTTAVIPAAGLGSRFLPATKAVPKELLTIVDRPAIQHVVEEAVAAGIDQVVMIVSPSKMAIEQHFVPDPVLEHALVVRGKSDAAAALRSIGAGARFRFVHQHEPRGLGDAVLMAEPAIGNEPFAVLLPDHIMRDRDELLRAMLAVHEHHRRSVVLLREVELDEIGSYGCAAIEPLADHVVRIPHIVEKPAPEDAPSNLAVAGRYVFTSEIFNHLRGIQPGHGDEIQLTDAMAGIAEDGDLLGLIGASENWDIGQRLGYLHAQIELGLQHPDLGQSFASLLRRIVGGV